MNQLSLFEEEQMPAPIKVPNANIVGTCNVFAPQLDIVAIRQTTFYNVNKDILSSAGEVHKYLKGCFNPAKLTVREEIVVLFLSRRNHVLAWAQMSSGSSTGCVCDVKHIMFMALQINASALIISHNHPSGSLRPSPQDKMLTDKLKRAAECHDISLLDHVIVTEDSYYSFADEGLI